MSNGFYAFVGNPPFAGKNRIVDSGGEAMLEWFMTLMPELRGRPNTDLCAYFFRRAAELIGEHGTLGFVATNTIAEGDSRLMSLKVLVDAGARIVAADSSMPWPGDAAVNVALVTIAFGNVSDGMDGAILDGKRVQSIDSRLTAQAERSDAGILNANYGLALRGGKLVGIGLAVTLDEYVRLIAADPRNREVLRPYLGGEEVNTNPRGDFGRYMIDFSNASLEQAAKYPLLMRIIEEKVRPAREKDKRGTYKTYWWRPGESGGALYRALQGKIRCLVITNVTKHLVLSFYPTNWFFSNTLVVFAFDSNVQFAVLQSRIHEPWARLLSSSLEDRLRYSASDCFETFPFPKPDPRAVLPDLETAGQSLYEARTNYMVESEQGLTKTYNALKDPLCTDPRILELRRLHEATDRAVLDAYGWTDIAVPPYCPRSDADRQATQTFEEEVIDRLYFLNAERVREERRLGLVGKNGKRAPGHENAERSGADDAPAKPARRKKDATHPEALTDDQEKLFE